MSKSIYESPLLSAKIVKSMIEVPSFLAIINTYEELYILKQKCIQISEKHVSQHNGTEENVLELNDRLKRNKHIIKQYIEQQIENAKNSNGNWANLNTLSSEQIGLEKNAKVEISKTNSDFKANLEQLEKLESIDEEETSLEDRASIAAITILLKYSITKYIASNSKPTDKTAVA
ncbi:MAG: hypothetical protein U9Q66_01935 [Patescibacteria group bacterium]|nr:hypothetical protein [Patescibacteria group bacterium]